MSYDIFRAGNAALGSGRIFIAMAIWTLIPDKFDAKDAKQARFGVFGTTLFAFFLAELGDNTQITTVALAAQFQFVQVVAGTTFGMMLANVPAVLLGDRIAGRVPAHIVHRIAEGELRSAGHRHTARCRSPLRRFDRPGRV